MKVRETKLKGCFIIEPQIFEDERGYFFESFNQKKFEELIGTSVNFVQDNQSYSGYGTIRGLHFQEGDHAQAKLVRVIEGEVRDVAVDLRKHSPTYKQWVAVDLNGKDNLQLFIPRGFAHGFSVLSKKALFVYKCDNYYNKESEGGILFSDPSLNIDWRINEGNILVSDKDIHLPRL